MPDGVCLHCFSTSGSEYNNRGEFLIWQHFMVAYLGDDSKHCFQIFTSRFYEAGCLGRTFVNWALCGSACIVLFKIPDRLICMTLSMDLLLCFHYQVDMFQTWMVVRLDWSGVDRITGCWLFRMDDATLIYG